MKALTILTPASLWQYRQEYLLAAENRLFYCTSPWWSQLIIKWVKRQRRSHIFQGKELKPQDLNQSQMPLFEFMLGDDQREAPEQWVVYGAQDLSKEMLSYWQQPHSQLLPTLFEVSGKITPTRLQVLRELAPMGLELRTEGITILEQLKDLRRWGGVQEQAGFEDGFWIRLFQERGAPTQEQLWTLFQASQWLEPAQVEYYYGGAPIDSWGDLKLALRSMEVIKIKEVLFQTWFSGQDQELLGMIAYIRSALLNQIERRGKTPQYRIWMLLLKELSSLEVGVKNRQVGYMMSSYQWELLK